jgi:hypothetical protein
MATASARAMGDSVAHAARRRGNSFTLERSFVDAAILRVAF